MTFLVLAPVCKELGSYQLHLYNKQKVLQRAEFSGQIATAKPEEPGQSIVNRLESSHKLTGNPSMKNDFLHFYLFIFTLFEYQRNKERGICLPLVYYLKVCNLWDWDMGLGQAEASSEELK